jgi:hypothetical protein
MASYYRQYLIERGRPRHYTERGLVKLSRDRDAGAGVAGVERWSCPPLPGIVDEAGACNA